LIANERPDFSCRLIVQANAGAAAARNAGIRVSTGEYIQYLDSDDVMHPQKLELHVSLLCDNPEFDYVWSTHAQFLTEPDNEFMTSHDLNELRRQVVKTLSAGVLSTTAGVYAGLYRRRLHALAGPQNEQLKVWEDVEFAVRMTALRPNVIFSQVDLIAVIYGGPPKRSERELDQS
jgi:glycosyltransferase involved in cell wall biosynthesis